MDKISFEGVQYIPDFDLNSSYEEIDEFDKELIDTTLSRLTEFRGTFSLFSSLVFCSILMTWYFTVEGSTQSALALPL